MKTTAVLFFAAVAFAQQGMCENLDPKGPIPKERWSFTPIGEQSAPATAPAESSNDTLKRLIPGAFGRLLGVPYTKVEGDVENIGADGSQSVLFTPPAALALNPKNASRVVYQLILSPRTRVIVHISVFIYCPNESTLLDTFTSVMTSLYAKCGKQNFAECSDSKTQSYTTDINLIMSRRIEFGANLSTFHVYVTYTDRETELIAIKEHNELQRSRNAAEGFNKL